MVGKNMAPKNINNRYHCKEIIQRLKMVTQQK